ncbi:MAG: DM13 domain-containing protein [Geminicoccaceae bacterium]
MTRSGLIYGLAIAAPLLAGCAQLTGTTPAPAPTAASLTPASVSGQETARGSFVGASDHITTGTASVFRTDAGWVVALGPDFSLDGAPDPKVGFGDGEFVEGTLLGPLNSLTGQQVYTVPASLDVGDYNQIYIWCEQFSVPLGVADLELL